MRQESENWGIKLLRHLIYIYEIRELNSKILYHAIFLHLDYLI